MKDSFASSLHLQYKQWHLRGISFFFLNCLPFWHSLLLTFPLTLHCCVSLAVCWAVVSVESVWEDLRDFSEKRWNGGISAPCQIRWSKSDGFFNREREVQNAFSAKLSMCWYLSRTGVCVCVWVYRCECMGVCMCVCVCVVMKNGSYPITVKLWSAAWKPIPLCRRMFIWWRDSFYLRGEKEDRSYTLNVCFICRVLAKHSAGSP